MLIATVLFMFNFFPPQAGDPAKELMGLPALSHMIQDIKVRHSKKEKITLQDLDLVMPFKCIMGDQDRKELGSLARDAISELGSLALETSSTAGSSTDKADKPSDKKASILNFFG
jgi:hypothetical protein